MEIEFIYLSADLAEIPTKFSMNTNSLSSKRTSEYLVKEYLDMIRREVLGRHYDLMQVGLHQFRHDVNLVELVEGRSL